MLDHKTYTYIVDDLSCYVLVTTRFGMDICKHADTFVCNVLLCIILAFTTTCGSLSPGMFFRDCL